MNDHGMSLISANPSDDVIWLLLVTWFLGVSLWIYWIYSHEDQNKGT